jgi:thioredoxin reductase (NADPH)
MTAMAEPTLHSIAFPTLDDAQILELSQCTAAAPKVYRDGQTLIEVGDRDFKFFIIRSGEVEILDQSGNTPRTIAVLGRGEFTGDVAHLTGRASVISAVARGECVVVEISTETLREAINQCPVLSDIILQAFIARRQLLRESPDFIGLRVIGSRYSTDTFRVRDFLAKNRMLFTWVDVETDPAVDRLLKHFGTTEADTPVVALGDLLLLRNPSNRQLADALGIRQPLEHTVYDLAVVGAGPAGLAAAVYGASEGLHTVLLERTAPGGQAGSSMRIENYLGFPTGVTGGELADRAILQANKFGARLSVPTQAIHVGWDSALSVVQLDDGQTVTTKCLLIATGADYRRLDVDECERFEGKGVYYAATLAEGQMCRGTQVVLVGAGNSAGQAAVFLAQHARTVLLLFRGHDLYASMSSYLAHRIEQTPNIDLLCNTDLLEVKGNNTLEGVTVKNTDTEAIETFEAGAMFVFIGVRPQSQLVADLVKRSDRGYIFTGPDLIVDKKPPAGWTLERDPFLLETSIPGIFAAGDVRYGTNHRVASAVGEGAIAHALIKEYLKTL